LGAFARFGNKLMQTTHEQPRRKAKKPNKPKENKTKNKVKKNNKK